jgi:hypothetical protein
MRYTGTQVPSPPSLSPSDGARESHLRVWSLFTAFCRLSCGLATKAWARSGRTDRETVKNVMKNPEIHRREFMKAAALSATGMLLGRSLITSVNASEPMRIEEPFHGAVLNRRHGREVEGGLEIQVRGEAPLNDRVVVNGTVASRAGTQFSAAIVLRQKETVLHAQAEGVTGRREHQVRVLWDRKSEPRYRFSIDDNSFFLRDISQKQYGSLFDCFYLKLLRDLHKKYGVRFVLNIYYRTADGFELPQFPERYRGEWRDNADWLRLSFHAYANDPDRPYQYASPSRLIGDLEKVAGEIVRFAGESVYSPPTVIHWAMVPPAVLKPLHEHGVRVLSGFFEQRNGAWDINYSLDDARSEYLSRHDALMDFESGIVFSKVDIVCNNVPKKDIEPALAKVRADPNQAEIMDLFTHEQYFWPFYANYIPDHGERLDTAIRWVTEQGYKPVFFHEGFLGGAE